MHLDQHNFVILDYIRV